MTAPTQVRLRAICAHYGVSRPDPWTYIHPTLDILDQRAGIGTRGGSLRTLDGIRRPVNFVGERIEKHEAHIARQELALHARHYFHLGAQG